MSVFDIFSKRQKELRREVPDVYTYDEIPQPLRVQIIHIWNATLGDANQYYTEDDATTRKAYQFIAETLCREYGLFSLTKAPDHQKGRDYLSELATFLLNENNPQKVLDAVELSFWYIDKIMRHQHRKGPSRWADEAIGELNARFREHGVGYEYDGDIIRVDSQLLHVETVKPALALLRVTEYAGAQTEFLAAHEHYRHRRTNEALTECLKALESVMRAICAKRSWPCDPNATAKALLAVLFDKGLVPPSLTQHLAALRSTLEAGIPTGRNKLGGHGQGVKVVQVPAHLVAYVLHLTASAIVFLAAAERDMT